MQQLLAVSVRNEWPRGWALPEYDTRFVIQIERADLTPEVSAVVVQAQSLGRLRATSHVVEETRGELSVAMLLAGRPELPDLEHILYECQFDGFLDLGWPQSLARACLELAVRNVQQGRELVEIQRAVLLQTAAETQALYQQANHDDLTKLFNQRHFSELMAREHERNKRGAHQYALVYIDLDDLKGINTRHGHEGGSEALRALARVMTESLRASDVALRVGGDEFVVYLPDCDKAAGVRFSQRVRENLDRLDFRVAGGRVPLSFSAGVASFPEDGQQYATLLDRADHALLEAKLKGKNRTTGFAGDPHQQPAGT